MAIDKGADNLTFNRNGFAFKNANAIIHDQIDYILTHTDRINDFTTGSIARTLIEANATEIEKLYYYTLENLQTAIDEGVTSAFGFSRREATYAYGNILVEFSTKLPENLTIDRGTRFYSNHDGYEQVYQTQVAYNIPRGTSSVLIPVYCTVVGTYGNIPANIINRTSDLGAIREVTNPEAFMTGQDEESPEAEKIRFRQMIQSLARGTNQSLVYAAESVPEISGGYEFESTYGTVIIFCNDANGDLSDELRQKVADKLVEYRPAGIRVFVMPTHKTMMTLNIGVEVSDSRLENDDFLSEVERVVSNYINSFEVGQDFFKNDLIQKIMDISDYGVTDTNVDVRMFPDERMQDYPMIDEDTIINVKNVLVDQPYLHPRDITNSKTYGEVDVPNTHLILKSATNWKDAFNKDKDDEYSINNSILIEKAYRTNPNEIIRLGNLNIHFMANDEELSNEGTQTINYVDDGGKIIGQQVITGKTDESKPVTLQVPAGWKITMADPKTIPTLVTIKPNDTPIMVTVEHIMIPIKPGDLPNPSDVKPGTTEKMPGDGKSSHDITYNDLHKTITRTVTIKDPHNGDQDKTQTLTFERTGTIDDVTGDVTYGDWTPVGQSGSFTEVTIPDVDGYTKHVSAGNLTGYTPSQDQITNWKDPKITATYTANDGTETNGSENTTDSDNTSKEGES